MVILIGIIVSVWPESHEITGCRKISQEIF